MPDLPNRLQHELALMAEIQSAFAEPSEQAQQDQEPDWEKTRNRMRDALTAALLLLFGITVSRFSASVRTIRVDALDRAGASYAATRAAGVADVMITNMRAELEVLRQSRLLGIGTAEPMTAEEFLAGLQSIFGDTRAARAAATEVTTAISAAELAASEQYTAETGQYLKATWNTEQDGLVCPICFPLDGETEDLSEPVRRNWGREFSDGPPAHANCRCWLSYE